MLYAQLSPTVPARFTARITPLLLIAACVLTAFQTKAQPGPTPAAERLQSFDQRRALKTNSLLQQLEAEAVGPTIFSCRVTDVDANPADPTEMYVAYASGGLWHSTNNGIQFEPIFDHEASMTIGDIAIDWQRHSIWVGTGEANSSRSSYAGTGVYRSDDMGKTWQYCGLPESHHIARIVLHPTDPNTIWVAVLGHLYTNNPERGVFKSSDGGKTWQHSLSVNDQAGAIDLTIDPNDPNTLYAATWQRSRQAWNFSGAGPGSAIWKSSDGGATWNKINGGESGFPAGDKIGRIGLCAGKKDGKTVLYACVDNQTPNPKKAAAKEDALTKDQLRDISKTDFLKLNDEKLDKFLRQNEFPEKYDAKKVKSMVDKDKIKPVALVEYLEDANSSLFETDYAGAELYRSDDGGLHWKRTHEDALDQLFFTYGYYFANVRCAPDNADQVYLIGFYILRSDDGGKTWKNINKENVHVDHHALWINPARPSHLVNGNDGGLNISWDNGESWLKCNSPHVGQLYAIATDNDSPYNIYGGAQDNGVWAGPSDANPSAEWLQTGRYPYKELLSGDGMQVQVDTRDNNTVYTGFQFGNYFKINKSTGKTIPITPKHDLGERPLRFNWQTPIWLSRHQQDVLYLGANKLYRSFNQGNDWEAISGDLTNGGKAGNVPYGTLTTIHESPLKLGLLYTGSDDGLVYVTRDGGENWTRISDSLPAQMWVSRVQASAHLRSRVYVSLNGYRWDHFSPYLYTSENYGKTWTRIGLDLPQEPVNVVLEDPVNPDLLFVGTDHGLYVSLDRGNIFQSLSPSFPDVPVHDLKIQPDAKDLVIGTHGRSIFKVNIEDLEQMTPELLTEPLHVFSIASKKYSRNWGKKQPYKELKDPTLPLRFYAAAEGPANWVLKHKETGEILQTGAINCKKGLNQMDLVPDIGDKYLKKYKEIWQSSQKDTAKSIDLEKADSGKTYLRKGLYIFVLNKNGATSEQTMTIE